MLSQATAALLVLTLFGASAGPCAGWESSAQARHDCCVDGHCPDEVSSAAGHGNHSGALPQAEADRCCAASEQKHQQRAAQFADASFALMAPAATSTGFDSITPNLSDTIARDRATAPSPPTRLHVRFSVLLV